MKKLNIFFAFFLAIALVACGAKENKEIETEGEDLTEKEMSAINGSYELAGDSQLMWEGTKPAGSHTGTLAVSEGKFVIADGKITEGNFTVDMSSLTVTDLEGEEKGKLEGHLKTADFFDAEQFPMATFKVTGSEKLEGDANATHKIMGDLTLKGATQPIEFMAKVSDMESGIAIASDFAIDRTRWDIEYNSKSSSKFENLVADKVIADDMGIKFDFKAMKK